MISVGEMLKHIRVILHITQKQLGDFIGMKDSQIRRYENGYSIPKASTLETILKGLFNYSVDRPLIEECYFIQVDESPESEIRYNFTHDYSYFKEYSFGLYFFDLSSNKAQYLSPGDPEYDFKKIFNKINLKKERNLFVHGIHEFQTDSNSESKIFSPKLYAYYNKLNEVGVKKLLDYASDLTKIDEYTAGSDKADKKQVDVIPNSLREQHEKK